MMPEMVALRFASIDEPDRLNPGNVPIHGTSLNQNRRCHHVVRTPGAVR